MKPTRSRRSRLAGRTPAVAALLGLATLGGCTNTAPTPPVAPPQAMTLEGDPIDPIDFDDDTEAVVLLFARTDCPISNRYAPEVGRICDAYTPRGVRFYMVYPNPDATADAIRQHLKDYRYTCEALHDPEHVLVKRAKATITPEAAVFDGTGTLVYHGRIDDWYAAFGQSRPAPTTHDLRDVLDAVLDGRPVEQETAPAVGCFILDLE